MIQGAFLILVTDRNPNVREFLLRELRKEGFRAIAAKDGAEVAALIDSQNPPDLLVLDCETPRLKNNKALRQALERPNHVPFIMHCYGAEDELDCLAPLATETVEKGPDISALRNAVMRVLKQHFPAYTPDDERSRP